MSDKAGHERKMLARYRSQGQVRKIVEYEWIQSLIALEKIGYFYTLLVGPVQPLRLSYSFCPHSFGIRARSREPSIRLDS